jgi:hypothetical protein
MPSHILLHATCNEPGVGDFTHTESSTASLNRRLYACVTSPRVSSSVPTSNKFPAASSLGLTRVETRGTLLVVPDWSEERACQERSAWALRGRSRGAGMILPAFGRRLRAVFGERKSSTYLARCANPGGACRNPFVPVTTRGSRPPRITSARLQKIQDQRIGNIWRRERSRRMAHHVYRQSSEGRLP